MLVQFKGRLATPSPYYWDKMGHLDGWDVSICKQRRKKAQPIARTVVIHYCSPEHYPPCFPVEYRFFIRLRHRTQQRISGGAKNGPPETKEGKGIDLRGLVASNASGLVGRLYIQLGWLTVFLKLHSISLIIVNCSL
jgi:hypothetical protein